MHERSKPLKELVEALTRLVRRLLANAVTKQELQEMEKRIMSKISDWAAQVEPKLDAIQKGIDDLQQLVEDFQNSDGELSTEDQARLDAIQVKVNAIASDAGNLPTPPA